MMFKRSNLSRCLAVALALWTGGPVFAAFNGPSTFTPSGQLPETLQARALLQAFVQDYGASGSTATASGSSITGATAALTLGSAQDFKNGQGVLIPGAGSTETAPASSCTATVNGVAGSTTINYYVVTLDSNGGYAAAGTCQTTTANATLSAQNNVSLAVTIGAAASFSGYISNGTSGVLGNTLKVTSWSSGIIAEGQSLAGSGIPTTAGLIPRVLYQVSGTPGQTGVYLLDSQQNVATSGSPEAMTSYAGYAVWKSGGSYVSEHYLGAGDQATFVDAGLSSQDAGGTGPYRPSWLPATHPISAVNDWCVRTIVSGGGSTALTLASSCPNTASSVAVSHDDTAAFNACLAVGASPGVECKVPAGQYNVSGGLTIKNTNTRLSGAGRASRLNWYGTQDLFAASGTPAAFIYGTQLQSLYMTGQNTNALGKTYALAFETQLANWSGLYTDDPYDGFSCADCNIQTITDLGILHMSSQTGSCFHYSADGNGGGNAFYARFIYCSTIGTTLNYGTRQKCFWFDGAVAGGDLKNGTEGSCAGEGLRVSNDIGAGNAPFGLHFGDFNAEFSTVANAHFTGNAYEIDVEGGTWTDAGWQNFTSCGASANLVIDSGSKNIVVSGGAFYAASGDGIYDNGASTTIRPGSVFNNSLAASGGAAGACPGLELGGAAASGTVAGIAIGKASGSSQAEPVLIDAGATGNAVGQNGFMAGGNVLNHVVDNSVAGSGNVVANNAGSDVNDAVGPPLTYTGIGDLGLSSMVSYWGLRCYSNAYHGNVADIWDSSTGSTTETKLTCSPGGFLNQTVNPLATTCASGCKVKTLYDQVGSNDLTQATNANRPTFAQSGCGFTKHSPYPYCLQFLLANTQYLRTGTVSAIIQPLDLNLSAVRTGSYTTAQYAMTLSSSTSLQFRNVANGINTTFGSGVTSTAADNAWHAISIEADGASLSAIQVDGSLQSSLNLGTNATGTVWTMGATGSSTSPFTGAIVEAFVTSAVNGPNATASLLPLVNQNLHFYWGF